MAIVPQGFINLGCTNLGSIASQTISVLIVKDIIISLPLTTISLEGIAILNYPLNITFPVYTDKLFSDKSIILI